MIKILIIIIAFSLGNSIYTGYAETTDVLFDQWEQLSFYEEEERIGWIDLLSGRKQSAIYSSVDPLDEEYFIVSTEKGYGVANRDGLLLEPVWAAVYPCSDFKHNHIVFLYSKRKTVAYDLKNKRTVYIAPSGERIVDYCDLRALIRQPDENWKVIDENGHIVFSFSAEYAEMSCDQVLIVANEEGFMLMDMRGRVIQETPFLYISPMVNGLSVFMNTNSNGDPYTGLIDCQGRIVCSTSFLDIGGIVSYNRLWFRQNDQYGFLNTEGKVAVEPIWDFVSDFSNGMARVCLNGKYGYIDVDGGIKIPVIYEDASDFQEEKAVVVIDNIPGIIDSQGNPCLKADHLFDTIYPAELNRDLFIAHRKTDERWYYISYKGEIICPYVFWSEDVLDYLDVDDG